MALEQARPYGLADRAGAAQIDEGLRKFMLGVYNYLACGLAVSGIVAVLVANTPVGGLFFEQVNGRLVGVTALGTVAIWAPLVMLLIGMFAMRNAGVVATQAFFWAFVAVKGVGLSVLLMVYTDESLARVFFITAASFAGLSIWGYTTQKNLSGWGSFLLMAVIGILIASLVNMIFFQSGMMMMLLSVVTVLVFAALIAYDTQSLKHAYLMGLSHEEAQKTAIWGALNLYISFVVLLQHLLSLFGDRE